MKRKFIIIISFILFMFNTLNLYANDKNIKKEKPAALKHEIFIDAGLLSPVGFFGFGYSYLPNKWSKLEISTGIDHLTGLQLSLMPKLIFGSSKNRFITGAGISLGVPVDSHKEQAWLEDFYWEKRFIFLNLEFLGYEWLFISNDYTSAFHIAVGMKIGISGSMQDMEMLDAYEKDKSVKGEILGQLRLGYSIFF